MTVWHAVTKCHQTGVSHPELTFDERRCANIIIIFHTISVSMSVGETHPLWHLMKPGKNVRGWSYFPRYRIWFSGLEVVESLNLMLSVLCLARLCMHL